jgi:hypothetical protein
MSTLIRVIETGEEIRFHAEVTAGAESKNKVATHPVSGRAPSTDHIESSANTYDIQALTTQSPFGKQITPTDILGLNLETEVISFFERNRRRYMTLTSLRMGVITPVALTGISRKYDNRLMCTFDLSFQEVRYAEAERVKLPARRVKKKTVEPPKDETNTTPLEVAKAPGVFSEFSAIFGNPDGNTGAITPQAGSAVFNQIDRRNAELNASLAELKATSGVGGSSLSNVPVTGAGTRNAYLPSGPKYVAPTASNNFVQLRR